MAYQIYAYKGRKTMPIKLEEKHKYYNSNVLSLNVYPQDATPVAQDSVRGYGITSANLLIFGNTDNFQLPQGITENTRIGNKTNIKRINYTIAMWMPDDVIATYISHSENVNMKFHFRIMTVKFNEAKSAADIAAWYRGSYIYYRLIGTGGGNSFPIQSNWMDRLRESTEFTGSFKIIKDYKFTVDKDHTNHQINYDLNFDYDVNFDNITNKPTENQEFSHIYTFIIGPANNNLDMDTISSSKVDVSTIPVPLFSFTINEKCTYFDM